MASKQIFLDLIQKGPRDFLFQTDQPFLVRSSVLSFLSLTTFPTTAAAKFVISSFWWKNKSDAYILSEV